uniref:(northern house mosquito) hypothetical protein n=1 Tax=Culex pipiens TaxID=7175 RepID=A0A8D8C8S4_CULPI
MKVIRAHTQKTGVRGWDIFSLLLWNGPNRHSVALLSHRSTSFVLTFVSVPALSLQSLIWAHSAEPHPSCPSSSLILSSVFPRALSVPWSSHVVIPEIRTDPLVFSEGTC